MSDSNDDKTRPDTGRWTDETVEALYASGASPAPAELDAPVLAYAAKKQAAPSGKLSRLRAGSGAFATAAVLVLTIAIFLRGGDMPDSETLAAKSAPATSAPAAPAPASVAVAETQATLERSLMSIEADPATAMTEGMDLTDNAFEPGDRLALEEIVVTAARREHTLGDAPAQASPAEQRARSEHTAPLIEGIAALPATSFKLSHEPCAGPAAALTASTAPVPDTVCSVAVSHHACKTPFDVAGPVTLLTSPDDAVRYRDGATTYSLRCVDGTWVREPLEPPAGD